MENRSKPNLRSREKNNTEVRAEVGNLLIVKPVKNRKNVKKKNSQTTTIDIQHNRIEDSKFIEQNNVIVGATSQETRQSFVQDVFDPAAFHNETIPKAMRPTQQNPNASQDINSSTIEKFLQSCQIELDAYNIVLNIFKQNYINVAALVSKK